MRNENCLNVWYEKTLIGKIWQDAAGIMGFRYEEDWVNQGFAISQQLPLNTQEYSPALAKAHRFFANLLPEGNAREHIVKNLKLSNTDFELLKALGGECAGAFSILPIEQEPSKEAKYKKITTEELRKLILRKGKIINVDENESRVRLSLAGAQDKCAIFFDKKNYFWPLESSPSTHILKFATVNYRNVPLYEYFLTTLAKTVGLPVVKIEFIKNPVDNYLLIKRYDRILKEDGSIQRLHQEDFCQALGIGHEKKYEQNNSSFFKDCYQLLRKVAKNPIKDLENLLRWQIFNVLAGNSDGHTKNLALIYDLNHHAELAPFYDLVCTRAIEEIDSNLAMSVGGQYNPSNILLDDWKKLAQECDIGFLYLKKQLQTMAESLLNSFSSTQEEFEERFGSYPALQRIEKVVNKQCEKVLKQIL